MWQGGIPAPAESVEGRGLAKGNLIQQNRPRTQRRTGLNSALDWIRMMPLNTCVTYPRQEPSAVVPLAEICAGGAGQPAINRDEPI